LMPAQKFACQVVPDIPTFAVDDGFTYGIREGTDVGTGARVRVRVSGRRLKGFVTAVIPYPDDREILDIDGVVGNLPSFGEADLHLLRWAASYYVAPLSTILKRTIPANVPRGDQLHGGVVPARNTAFTARHVIPDVNVLQTLLSIVEEHGKPDESILVVAPSVREVDDFAVALRRTYGERVSVAHSSLPAKETTHSWVTAATSGGILIGTREVALWPVEALTLMVVIEDGRRVMKSPSTPTIGVREVALERCRNRRIPLVTIGSIPTLEMIHAGANITSPPGRLWPLVEVVDRGEQAPSAAPVLERTRTAIGSAVSAGGQVFVLVPRRAYAPAYRCTTCGAVRRCLSCRAVVGPSDVCARCAADLGDCEKCGNHRWQALGAGIGSVVDDLKRSLGAGVGTHGEGRQVTVGTERDLIGLTDCTLAVAIGLDGMALAPNYRAGEDTLRLLVRLAQTVAKGRGHRCLVQTSDAGQPVVTALRSGRYEEFLDAETHNRRRSGFPPSGQLIAVEIGEVESDDPLKLLKTHANLLGPATLRDRKRWLVHARDLTAAKTALRSIAGKLRDRGSRVRIDVDPIDL
jgi:primosomal protein N' (replication factor Y)